MLIIENENLRGLKSELSFLDQVTEQLGFIRWQWETRRATYDCEIEHDEDTYVLRINTRAVEGKLESPTAVLVIEDIYVGKMTYPQGLDYEIELPATVSKTIQQKLEQLEKDMTV